MTRIRPLAVVAIAVLVLAACDGDDAAQESGDTSPSAAAPTPAAGEAGIDGVAASETGPREPATVSYWHAYNEAGAEAKTLNEVVIPRFEEEHPDITIDAVSFPYDDLHQKLITATAGDTLPCLVRSDIIWVPELAELGVLVPLDEQMDDFDTLAERTYEATLATNHWDGNYYGLPLDTNTRVLMYNQGTLDAAGVDQPPASFDELRALADGLEGSGRFAFADNGTSGWNLLPWIWSAGGSMTDEDLTSASGHLNSQASVAGVQLLVDLHEQGAIPDLIMGADGGIATSEGLPKGDYATIMDGPWMFPIFEGQYPDFELQTAPMPSGDGGSISVVGGEDLVMTQSCEDKEAAAEVVRFMLSDFAQTEMAKVGQMPVLADLGETLTDIEPYYGIFAEQLETARPRPPHPQYPKIEEVLSTEVQKAFRGDMTVQEALDSAAGQIDQILAQG